MRVRFALAIFLGLSASLAQAFEPPGSTYLDPSNRFTIFSPSGWKVRALGDGVQIVRGDSYASVMTFEHPADAQVLLDDLAAHIGKKWQKFELLDRKNTTLSGSPAEVATFRGINPQALEATLKLTCAVVGQAGYVLVIGSPAKELSTVQDTLAQIERSFTLLNGAAALPVTASSGSIGVELTDLTPDDASMYHLAEPSGALVIEIENGGPAAQAGLQLHDVILTTDGKAVEGATALQGVIESRKGDVIELKVCRIKGDEKVEQITLRVTVAEKKK